jgi:hypothetical protein
MGELITTVIICGGAFLALTFIIHRILTRIVFPELSHRPRYPAQDAETGTVDPYQIRLIHDGSVTK